MKPAIVLAVSVLGLSVWTSTGADIVGTVRGSGRLLPDAAVYIAKIEGKVFPPPEQPVIINQINLTFVPHVAPVLVGTKVTFPNSDFTMHNVFSPHAENRFDLGTYKAGESKSIECRKTGTFAVLCHIHHEMSAYLVVIETPYAAITNQRGEYAVTNVPPGKYKLTAWHETMKPKVEEIEVTETNGLTMHFVLRR